MQEELKINPEYTKLVPELCGVEYQVLKESIGQNGLWHPITVNQNYVVLDGHHRLKICQELGIKPRVEVKQFEDPLYEKLFVIGSNLNRRHLNIFTRVELALLKKPIFQEIAKEKQRKGGLEKVSQISVEPIRVDEQIAKDANTSRDTVRKIEFLQQYATVEKLDRLRQGKARINKECKLIQLEQKRQQLINESPKVNVPNNCVLYLGDFIEICKTIPDNYIPLIVTDPPYAEKYLYLYRELAKLAQRVLKPHGSLFTFYGEMYRPTVMKYFEEAGLTYWWRIIVKHTGHTQILHARNIIAECKEYLWYVKGSKPNIKGAIKDYVVSEPPDKDLHEWAQSPVEAEHVIKALTEENQIVLDPFMGTGTTGIAALNLNRKFIGIDIDKDTFSIAKARLANKQ